ncbi:bifunctional DNA-formamidopyrimidine glycosylase/DNA-(apurinic or apyrimidinic site) lyase [Rhodoferax sp.]|uniref:bifunctional DNA-formamidopyrimidine glycosylase/DNA-(apurinic or apyrimidinic site) lyase n=1 Tax=Rhodoferax sp. TaxID=50421 RepID=UPI0025E92B85|nr:bifunctional DNA-formamidopyrimidine glycosylase/DNA-(apurinic or apyrimidinic site) lyase [Rhodoferax sp.]MCM2342590.1 bifunctional DNA-formamidopyrimidine glycosylase/DNA-(apurinic or apyrimidinic site) lyase [Rhodoferax sp.]
MPELPEVEVTRRSFAHAIENATVQAVRLGKPLRWPLGCDPDRLPGRRVRSVGRRGKYLLLQFDQGVLLVHLGMSGSLRFAPVLPAAGAHDHFDLVTTQGTLRLHDPRRFGAVVYVDSLADPVAHKLLGRLGPEPLSDAFDVTGFQARLKRHQSAIKSVLLAGEAVVGVGNIYASEALFLAGIRPTVAAARLSRTRVARLHAAIVKVLGQAVELGGSTLRDFSSASGQAGYFQLQTMVYGRAGLPCHVCASPVRLIKQGQRSTFYCATCQKP